MSLVPERGPRGCEAWPTPRSPTARWSGPETRSSPAHYPAVSPAAYIYNEKMWEIKEEKNTRKDKKKLIKKTYIMKLFKALNCLCWPLLQQHQQTIKYLLKTCSSAWNVCSWTSLPREAMWVEPGSRAGSREDRSTITPAMSRARSAKAARLAAVNWQVCDKNLMKGCIKFPLTLYSSLLSHNFLTLPSSPLFILPNTLIS